jgi:hypothetical protein
MEHLGQKSTVNDVAERGIVTPEANSSLPLKGDYERMARRRFQKPKPFREGAWW